MWLRVPILLHTTNCPGVPPLFYTVLSKYSCLFRYEKFKSFMECSEIFFIFDCYWSSCRTHSCNDIRIRRSELKFDFILLKYYMIWVVYYLWQGINIIVNSNNFYSTENGDIGDNVKNLINYNIVIFFWRSK